MSRVSDLFDSYLNCPITPNAAGAVFQVISDGTEDLPAFIEEQLTNLIDNLVLKTVWYFYMPMIIIYILIILLLVITNIIPWEWALLLTVAICIIMYSFYAAYRAELLAFIDIQVNLIDGKVRDFIKSRIPHIRSEGRKAYVREIAKAFIPCGGRS